MTNGVELATAWVRLVPTMEGVSDTITKAVIPPAERAGKSGGKTFGSGFKSAAAGFLGAGLFIAATRAVSDFVGESITSLARIETINTQTAQVIESTGGAANVSAQHVEALAGSLENLTATEAESIQEGANLLLTFKNIQNRAGDGNDIFDQTTRSLVDMARAMGQEPKAAAIQLGKALNDPIKGISALSRVGITFTEEQQNLIKSMVKTGDVAGAQKIILNELNSQFGGSGAAYAKTYQGQLDLMGHAFGTLGETIVGAVMPAFQGLMGVLVPVFQWLSENQPVLLAIASVIGTTLVAAMIAWAASIWVSTVALLANPITWIILAVIALVAAIVLLVTNWDAVVAWITEIWSGFISWITGVIDGFVSWWNATWAAVGKFISDLWNRWIVAPIRTAINWIAKTVSDTIRNIRTGWENGWSAIGNFVRGIWNNIVGWIEGGVNGAIDLINGFTGGIRDVAGAVFGVEIGPIPHVSLPRLAAGATILPRPGGTAAILAEAGKPETVVDTGLMNRALEEGLAGRGNPDTLVIVDADGQLIGRMRVEADRQIAAADDADDRELARGRW